MVSKQILIASIAVAVVLAGGSYYWWQSRNNNQPEIIATDASEVIADPTEAAKTQAAKPSEEDSPAASENSGSVIVSSVNQDASTVSIRTLVEGYSSGTCTLTLTRAGQTDIQRTADVVFAPPSYYACNGFNISKSDIPAKGAWKIKIVVSSDNKSAESESEVDID